MNKNIHKTGYSINFNYLTLMLFVAFILPFVYLTKGLDPALFPRYFALSLVVAFINLTIVFQLWRKPFPVTFTLTEIYVIIALSGYCAVSFISSLFAININEAVFESLKYFTLVNFFFQLLILHKTSEKSKDYLIISVIVFSLCILAVAIFQFLKLDFSEFFKQTEYLDYYYNQQMNKVTGTQANKNLLASLVFICTSFGFFAAINLKKWWKISGWVVSVLCLVFAAILNTRAVWLGVIVAVAIFLFFMALYSIKSFSLRSIKKLKLSYILIGIIIIALLFGMAAFVFTYKEGRIAGLIERRISQSFNKDDFDRQKLMSLGNPNSAQTRIIVWYKTLDLFNQNPLIGVGPGNWRIAIPSQNLDALEHDIRQGVKKLDRPHNDFLWVLSETGILGFITWYGFYFYIIVIASLIVFNAKNKTDRITGAIAIAVLSGYTIISLVDFPRERIEHQVLLLMLSALIIFIYDKISGTKQIQLAKKLLFPALITAVIVSVISVSAAYGKVNGEIQSNKFIQHQLAGNWNSELKYLSKTNSWFYKIDAFGAPVDWYRGIALLKTGKYNESIASFEKAYQYNPYNLAVLNNIAGAYFMVNNLDKAEEFYNKALAVSSRYEEALINLSIIYLRKDKTERAYQTILKITPSQTTPVFYEKVLGTILQKKTEKMSQKVSSKVLSQKLAEISKDIKYLVNIQKSAIKKQKTFKEELLLSLKK